MQRQRSGCAAPGTCVSLAALRHPQPDVAVERGVVLQQILRAGAVHDRAALQQHGVLGERQRDLGVLLDQDHGGAFLGDHACAGPAPAPRR